MQHDVPGSPVRDHDQPTPSATAAPAPSAAGGERPPREMSSTLRRAEQWIEHELERPGVGAVAIGTALIVAAAATGVSETVVGALGAYAVYRILKRRRSESARRAGEA